MRYDLIVIGSKNEGRAGAIAAAQLGCTVAFVEADFGFDAGCDTPGELDSPAPQAVVAGLRQLAFNLRKGRNLRRQLSPAEALIALRSEVVSYTNREQTANYQKLQRHGVPQFFGSATFVAPNRISVDSGNQIDLLDGERFLIACGSRLRPNGSVDFNGRSIITADEIWKLGNLGGDVVVVGDGVEGFECANCLARLGSRVTLIDGGDPLGDFCDAEVSEAALHIARSMGIVFRRGDEVIHARSIPEGGVCLLLASGRYVLCEQVVFASGRCGHAGDLNLGVVDLNADERGFLWCDATGRTRNRQVFGAGSVVGFPKQMHRSIDSERRAVYSAFEQKTGWQKSSSGFVLETIPPMAGVGETAESLEAARIPYEAAWGSGVDPLELSFNLTSPENGLLKVLFQRSSRKLLGLHCVGELAIEAVRCAESVLASEGRFTDLVEAAAGNTPLVRGFTAAIENGTRKVAAATGGYARR